MNRAVIYCRVSTEEEKQINALENEVESLKEIIVDDQYEIKRLKAQIKKLKESKAANNG